MTTQTAEQLVDDLQFSVAVTVEKAEAMLRSMAAELERLKNANTMLDAALIASHPRGAEGRVFELWNAARAALEQTK